MSLDCQNPNLITLTVVGDGEAEAGPLVTSWHSTKFLNPVTDGAVLPVLQWKVAGLEQACPLQVSSRPICDHTSNW